MNVYYIFITPCQHICYRLLRYVQPVPAREATTDELLKAHTPAHVHHYSPYRPSSSNNATVEEYDDDEEDPNPRARKMISIAALLNPEPPKRQLVNNNATMTKELSTVTTAATTHVVAPSTSKSKMICGQPGIGKQTMIRSNMQYSFADHP